MKRKLIALILCIVLCLATLGSSLAATLSATVQGSCKKAFTPSYYLQRSSSDNPWNYMREHCTSITYADDAPGSYMDFYLKSYTETGAAAAPNAFCQVGDTTINFYTGKKEATKVTFKVYNSHYYEEGDSSTKVSIKSTVYGYLQ